MVGSRFPFRDPNRRDDQSAGNRREDQPPGNRMDRDPNRRADADQSNRTDRDSGRRAEESISGGRPDRSRDPSGARRPGRDRGREEGDAPIAPPPGAGAAELAALGPEVETLVRLMTSTDVSELQIESGSLRVLIRRGSSPIPATSSPPIVIAPAPAPAAPPPSLAPQLPAVPGHGHPAASPLASGEHLITSPMVGTFFAAPAPQESPYVVEGDEVAVGQTVGIVEAMKMMNPIEAETAGRVARILVRDAQGIEYGQPLMVIAEG